MSAAVLPTTRSQQAVHSKELGQWTCSAHAPGSLTHPAQLENSAAEIIPAPVPGTVAFALQQLGRGDFDELAHIDEHDWCYRVSFSAPDQCAGTQHRLCFDGLATLAEVWLNGTQLLTTDNMFRRNQVDVTELLQPENQLVLIFRSLTTDLQRKRPRPRWKTNLVQQQQLRWHRTTLQGRIPGWSPPVPAIGPWRPVRLESSPVLCDNLRLVPRLIGERGLISVSGLLHSTSAIQQVSLRVGTEVFPLSLHPQAAGGTLQSEVEVNAPTLWWPHTHGTPALYDCELIVTTVDAEVTIECPKIGFRQVSVTQHNGFGLRLNGEEIYCRGACWTVSDIHSLTGTPEALAHDLRLARDAGVNMLRVGGTMVYESDRFYELCAELGILVWQDFMFANMDYPVENPEFLANITQEATEQLTRLAPYPCLAVYCGNSEIEQQAAMLGMPRDLWRNTWFGEQLPALCAELHPEIPYVPSTPSGGILPFHTHTGVTHFYGVGAYRRPTSELRQAAVKFTPECLGFSNVPDQSTIDVLTSGANPVMHSPLWKQRVPRDTGAGWDFEDIRDHYLQELYGVDPVRLRSWDMPRYLQLSRLVSGEMMSRVFSEWRSTHSHNHGGLVWFYKDLWPGAGWGVIDALGQPKAAYYALRRSWQNRQVTITDEGLNGLHLHLLNETSVPVAGTLAISLWKEPRTLVAQQKIQVEIAARGQQQFSADEILGSFYDVNYAYRFGPPHHDVVVATWTDATGQILSEAHYTIQRRDPGFASGVTLTATAVAQEDGTCLVTLDSDTYLHGVALHAKGYLPDDNHFSLSPGRAKQVRFRSRSAHTVPFKADITALNYTGEIRVLPTA